MHNLIKLSIKLINYFAYIFFTNLILSNNVNTLAKLNELQYNTTSGIYEAKLVKIAAYSAHKNRPTYVHKIVGIPYAEKPERFAQSVMKNYEPGIHYSQEPVFCHQSVNISAYGLFSLLDPPRMSEDCLTVNLYIPVPSSPEEEKQLKNMSVLIHIHGGSNMVGGASLFDGTMLAGHGKLIVAIINYRLSILGFLSDMTEKYSGNYGLRDQILAINWIKNNCPVLNCNPNSITLWGHSAGAGDVNWLSVSPLSNHLFQRVIIQSGSSFSYWGFDKMPTERYKALKTYFNCPDLPEQYTPKNGAMTKLIENCLTNVPLNDLFSFKFSLIDAPGPVYDGFLGENSLINEYTPKEMIDKNTKRSILDLDILTGINGVEGFSFEGYFSSSVRFWAQNNLTNEVVLTLERISLLTREKCSQGSIIANRGLIEQFYESKVEKLLADNSDINSEEAKRLKAIFVNSDFIFDIGFIELVKVLSEKRAENEYAKHGNLFVYEYLHENTGSQANFNAFKRYLKKNFPLSTHFDGIDLAFGLCTFFK
jgi:carboxylesterase type B